MSEFVRVVNDSKGTVLASRAKVAVSLIERAVGLLATPSLPPGEGLWLKPCRSIHTFFMRYPIDVLFVDGEGVVVSARTYVPWRMSCWEFKAAGVLELPAGTLKSTRTETGDRISMKAI